MGMKKDEAKLYEPPELRELGSVEELTKADGAQIAIDQNFPDGTVFGDLTFS